eukprot:474344-Amphidinium_carterae.1
MTDREILFDDVCASCTLTALTRAGKWRRAVHLFDTWRKRDARLGLSVHNAAINSCAQGHQWVMALSWFACMHRSSAGSAVDASGPAPDVVTYGALLHACARGAAWEAALSLLDSM